MLEGLDYHYEELGCTVSHARPSGAGGSLITVRKRFGSVRFPAFLVLVSLVRLSPLVNVIFRFGFWNLTNKGKEMKPGFELKIWCKMTFGSFPSNSHGRRRQELLFRARRRSDLNLWYELLTSESSKVGWGSVGPQLWRKNRNIWENSVWWVLFSWA